MSGIKALQLQAGVVLAELEEAFAGSPGAVPGPLREQIAKLVGMVRTLDDPCLYCGGPNTRSAKFCSDACRAKYGRERAPAGEVKIVRRLARGKVSVNIRFPPGETEPAIRYRIGDRVHLVEGDADQVEAFER